MLKLKTPAKVAKVAKTAKVITAAPVNRFAPHAEHLGFVAYAACETFAFHHAIWLVALWLFITGVWVMIGKVN